jgi:predicted DNA-binding transcriptional regulator YafY
MAQIRLTGEPRVRNAQTDALDLSSYSRQVFGMFNGELQNVRLRFENHLAGVVIDRFGREISLVPEDGEHFHVHVTVAVSPQFFGWVTGIGPGIEIASPADVREAYGAYLAEILSKYTKGT